MEQLMTKTDLKQMIDDVFPYMVEMRRYFHRYPELTAKEFNTSKFLKEKAVQLGMVIEEIPNDERSTGTGFIAIMDTGRPGKTLGLRTDIDALPIKENFNNLTGERVVISENDGVMQACGHDGHMAILLGAMEILSSLKDQLNGKIIFIFEEGEEASTGVYAMVDYLKKKRIDAIYGNHLYSGLETGKVAVSPGPVMSASLRIQMHIKGKGGHVSRPDLAINPVFAAAYIVTNLAGAWANQLPWGKTVTLGISQIQGSPARNVIADEAFIAGSLRYYDEEAGEQAFEIIKNVATSVAQAHLCTVEFSADSGPSARSVNNQDPNLVEHGQTAVEKLFPGALIKDFQWHASESFGHYQSVAPTLFTMIGTKNEQVGSGAEHHNEFFDLDEESLKFGVGTMVQFAMNFFENNEDKVDGE